MDYSEKACALLLDLIREADRGRAANAGELIGLFAALADVGEARAAREVFPFVFAEDLVVARGAAAAVDRLFRLAEMDDFVWFDRYVRVYAPVRPRYGAWREIRRDRAARAAGRTERFAAAAGVLSFHWNGYLREEMFRRLGEVDDPLAVPFVLLRLNDWVPEVRAAAAGVVSGWLERAWLGPLAQNLPLVTRLKGRVRSRHDELVDEVERRLVEEEPPDALISACRSRDRWVRREAFALGLRVESSMRGHRRAMFGRTSCTCCPSSRSGSGWSISCGRRRGRMTRWPRRRSGRPRQLCYDRTWGMSS